MQRKFVFGVGEYYHVYNRGNDKKLIFSDDSDQNRFVQSLFLLNNTKPVEIRNYGGQSSVKIFDPKSQEGGETLVDIGSYCLMPNHFHLLVREKTEGGLSLFMKKLLTSYSMYFNLKNKRTGALFEGPFKATPVTDDNHLNYLFAYIHLNPVKIVQPNWPETELAGIEQATEHLNNYPFSSYQDYLNLDRPEKAVLNKAAFPDYFAQPKDFGALIKDWMLYRAETGK